MLKSRLSFLAITLVMLAVLGGANSGWAAGPLADGFDYPIGASPPGRVTAANDAIDGWTLEQAFQAPNAEITGLAIEQGISVPAGSLLLNAGEDWITNAGGTSAAGQRVFAVAAGEVTGILDVTAPGSNDSVGSVIVIEHNLVGSTQSSVYLHVTPLTSLSVGDLVQRGEPIASIADISPSSVVTTPHLHFELRSGSIDVNDLWPNDAFFGYYLDEPALTADGLGQAPSAFIDSNRTIAVAAAPRLYVHDSRGNLGRIRVSDGLVDIIGRMDVVMTDIAFSPDGLLFGMSNSDLYQIDLVTADVQLIGAHGILGGNALVFASDGTLYGAGGFVEGLFEVNLQTGVGTEIADMGHSSAGDLVFFEDVLYLASSADQLVLVDLAELGSGTEIGTVVGDIGFQEVFGLATASDGIMYGTAGTDVFSVDVTTGSGSTPGVSFEGQGMTASFGSSFFLESGGVNAPLFTSVLPNSRSVQTGQVASVFLSAIVGGNRDGVACEPSLAPGFSGIFSFQVTDPATNLPIGNPNEAVDIAAGTARSFVLLIVPNADLESTSLEVLFGCQNTEIAEISRGINTLLLSASNTVPVDVVALGATVSNDGIVTLDPVSGAGAFAVAAINLGVGEDMTVTVDTGAANPLPVAFSVCETDPATSLCISPVGDSVATRIDQGDTPTFGVFVSGQAFEFSPGLNRVFVRFTLSSGTAPGLLHKQRRKVRKRAKHKDQCAIQRLHGR